MKVPFILYADLEPLPEKMSTCHNDPIMLSKTKINIYIFWLFIGYTLFI